MEPLFYQGSHLSIRKTPLLTPALIYGDSEGRCCQEQGWGQENFICLESDRKKEAWKFQRKLGSVPVTAPLFVFAQLAPVSELRVR